MTLHKVNLLPNSMLGSKLFDAEILLIQFTPEQESNLRLVSRKHYFLIQHPGIMLNICSPQLIFAAKMNFFGRGITVLRTLRMPCATNARSIAYRLIFPSTFDQVPGS